MAFIGIGRTGVRAGERRFSARAVPCAEESVLAALRADKGLRTALVALYFLVTALIGLAHQTPPVAVPGDIGALASPSVAAEDLAAAFAIICSGATHGKTHTADHGCDACRITHAPGLAGLALILAALTSATLRQTPDPVFSAPAGLVPVPHPARGPPSA